MTRRPTRWSHARTVGAQLGLTIREVPPSHQPLDWYRETAGRYREFPDYPNGAMGLSIAQEAQSHGSRVLVSGTGGDEWLGGSRLYCAEAIAGRRWREMLALLQRDRREAGLPAALWWQIRHGLLPLLPDSLRRSLRKYLDLAQGRRRDLPPRWLAPAMQQRLTQRRKLHEPEPLQAWGRIGQRRQWSHSVGSLHHTGPGNERKGSFASRTGVAPAILGRADHPGGFRHARAFASARS